MNKSIIGIAALIAGIVLLVYGFQATDSLGSELSEMFEGAPSDKAILLLVSGAILTVVGALTTFRRARVS